MFAQAITIPAILTKCLPNISTRFPGIHLILERGNFHIGVSLDSLQKENYESIWLNASFDKVMQNIKYFSEYSNQHNRIFTISTCVMRQNWSEVPNFVHYCNGIGAHATFHKVWSPLPYAIHNLSASELEAIYAELSGFQFTSGSALERKTKTTMNIQ